MENTEDVLAKISFLDKIIVQHKNLIAAVDGINACVQKSSHFRESVNCVLIANGGMGKTTICRQIISKSPMKIIIENNVEKKIIPSFYAEVPSPVTIKSVASSLLKKLGDPNPLSGTAPKMTDRLCHLLSVCETRLVLLDEFHHLLNISKTSTSLNSNVANWIKNLVNSTKVTFCLIGLPSFEPILRNDDQLSRRFLHVYSLRQLTLSGSDSKSELIAFLNQIQNAINDRLAPKNMPSFTHTLFAAQMYVATSGNPSFIMAIIKEALFIGLLGNTTTTVTKDDFVAAWETGITNTVSLAKQNPFLMSQGQLAKYIREVANV